MNSRREKPEKVPTGRKLSDSQIRHNYFPRVSRKTTGKRTEKESENTRGKHGKNIATRSTHSPKTAGLAGR